MANLLLGQHGGGPVGKNWALKFIRRHSELQSAFAGEEDCHKDIREDPLALEGWFKLLLDIVIRYDVIEGDIYSFDQTIFRMDVVTTPLVTTSATPSGRPKKTGSGNKNCVSTIQGINSQGRALPPFIIFGEDPHLKSWYNTSQLPPDWVLAFNNNGRATKDIYDHWIRHFDKNTRLRTIGSYRLLIFDAHSHHVSMYFQQYCKFNNILTLCMPPRSAHLLQPLEVRCLNPLEAAYHQVIDRKGGHKSRRITKLEFLAAYNEIYQASFTRDNIMSGFREAGLVPYNPDRVLRRRPSRTKIQATSGP